MNPRLRHLPSSAAIALGLAIVWHLLRALW